MNRRNFLARAGAAAAGALGLLAAPAWLSAAEPKAKTRIRIVYALHGEKQTGPDWPNKGFDFRPVMDRINASWRSECKGFEFVTSLATGEEQAKKILEQDKAAGGIDGYLVYQMNCWNRVVQTLADFRQAGALRRFPVRRQRRLPGLHRRASCAARRRTSVSWRPRKTKDLVEAVKCFQVVKQGGTVSDFVAATAQVRLKGTPGAGRLGRQAGPGQMPLGEMSASAASRKRRSSRCADQNAGPAGEVMGIKVEHVPFAELNEAWKQADKDESPRRGGPVGEGRRRGSKASSRETLETSAAMYLAEKALMKKHGANGITINCLGGFYGGHIHAYPCLGFYQLNNDGLIGGCECDVRSAATMVIGTTLTQGRPGYISDPVIDTSKRQIIYAHCVAHNKAFGPEGKTNPFEILTHSEDRQGASVRSHSADGLHDHHPGVRPGPQGNPVPSGAGRGQRPGRPRLPHQAVRRAGGRPREALPRCGTSGAGTASRSTATSRSRSTPWPMPPAGK